MRREWEINMCKTENVSSNAIAIENHPKDSRVKINKDGIVQTLSAAMGTGGGNTPMTMNEYKVRRLTVTECERLQGYPDGWTDIGEWIDSKGKTRQSTDAIRYKELGNSIAIPFWFWLLRRISAEYTRQATLGSLFDGIGGFPLCWEMCNGKGTARWASEIEEHAIAVTKVHFPEKDVGGVQERFDPVISFTRGDYMSTGDNVASTLMARDYKDPQAILRKEHYGTTNHDTQT